MLILKYALKLRRKHTINVVHTKEEWQAEAEKKWSEQGWAEKKNMAREL